MQHEKVHLLKELRIDRSEPSVAAGHGSGRAWAITAGAVLALAIAVASLVPDHSKAVPVHVAVAQSVSSQSTGAGQSILDASGYVVARRQATVSAKITGRLNQLFIEEGQHVKEGQVLARLDDTNAIAALEQAKATVSQAEAAVVQARAAAEDIAPTYQRNQKQAEAGLISAEALEASKAAYDARQTALLVAQSDLAVQRAAVEVATRNLNDTIVRAPFTGVITTKNAQPGEIVSPLSAGGGFTRTGIGTLVDMDSLEVEVDVNESYVSRVVADAPAILKLNAYPDWQIPAYVVALVPTADRSKATIKVRVGFKSRDPRILPEMGARVSFLDRAAASGSGATVPSAQAVLLPEEAIQPGAAGAAAMSAPELGTIYVLHESRVEKRAVRLGGQERGRRLVLSGVSPGERVAIGDFAALADGARITVVSQ
jgi:RND family efflux transporter MFP subunit